MRFAATVTLLLFAALTVVPAAAADLKIIAVPGVRAALNAIAAKFEHDTGNKVAVHYEILPNQKEALAAGDFDLAMFSRKDMERLGHEGKVVAATITDFASVRVGVAVRRGAPHPDISTPDAVKRAMLAAKSITFTRESATGLHMRRLIDQFGIAAQVKDKIKAQPGGSRSAPAVANGDAELGFVLVTDILATPGAELVGPLPDALQNYLTETVAIGAGARHPAEANALLKALVAPDQRKLLDSTGLGPIAR